MGQRKHFLKLNIMLHVELSCMKFSSSVTALINTQEKKNMAKNQRLYINGISKSAWDENRKKDYFRFTFDLRIFLCVCILCNCACIIYYLFSLNFVYLIVLHE